MSKHDDKLARLAAHIQSHGPRRRDAKPDVGELTEILSIDPVERICVAEPGVTFAQLVRATLAYGLVPVIVPELSTITVGGAVSGRSIESMSFARGGFHDTCIELEVMTASGDVLTCTRDNEHRLVFEMMQSSFGTLGILTKLAFELVPAKPYVQVIYETFATLADFQRAIRQHFDSRDTDFMDGIIHARDRYVLCLGRFVDRAPYTHRYERLMAYYGSTRERREDYLQVEDYLFRYDRGVASVRPRSMVRRLLFGDAPAVALDMFVPFSKVTELMAWYARYVDFYPIRCVPCRRVRDYPWLSDSYWAKVSDSLFLGLSIDGMRPHSERNLYRMIERELEAIGGTKTLVAHNYYAEREFWAIYNRPNYDAVKRIVDPGGQFRDLYDKTCRAALGAAR